ncbi:MAG TPA: hypothetical protein VFN87_08480 [Solirubrobacteraceae bacterium]|nr:hypothetical protein [Solirubrobacteraceae bacterium]
MLKIIESESNAWTVIAEDGELHIYSREDGEWAELALSEDSEQVDPDKSALLEELYQRETEDGGQEPRADAEDEAADEDEDEAADEDEEGDEDEDDEEEPEPQAEKPRRRRARSGGKR